jgi:hypothetical protein
MTAPSERQPTPKPHDDKFPDTWDNMDARSFRSILEEFDDEVRNLADFNPKQRKRMLLWARAFKDERVAHDKSFAEATEKAEAKS